jgi:hypothetical protein
MKKKRKKGLKGEVLNPRERIVKTEPELTQPTANDSVGGDSFDFGGLPRRDLKKNLGCG